MAIDIKREIELLRELQVIDTRVREIEDELALIPIQLEEARSEWSRLDSLVKAKEAEKAASEKEKRNLEAELEDSVARLREREGKLYSIKTNKEYQAALKEIADGKRLNKEMEDAILKLMEKIDVLAKEITQLSLMAVEKEGEFRKEEKILEEKKGELAREKDAHAYELKKIESMVEKSILEKYNFIRTKHADPISVVVGGICQGCNMNIPPQMYIELLKGLKFHFCPSCNRFIYPEEKRIEMPADKEEE